MGAIITSTIATKFGGSSLADPNQFKKVKDIIVSNEFSIPEIRTSNK